MRVIAGKYKSRSLITVKSNATRPTTDKNKENLYNIIGPYFNGGYCLDLFAGSGGLGIEALSRGMEHLYSVDRSYQAIQVIKSNVSNLKMNEDIHIIKSDYKRAISLFSKENIKFDLVLLDPPYGKKIIPPLLKSLQEMELLNDQCIVVCEDLKEEDFEEKYERLIKRKTVTYGITSLHIYKFEGYQ